MPDGINGRKRLLIGPLMEMSIAPAVAPIFKGALIVDDHPLFCDALSMTLKIVAEIETIETAERLDTAIGMLQGEILPDIIMLDLNLPDVRGLEGLIQLRKAAPKIPVIVVSSMAEDRLIASTLRAGAAGFVPKHSRREVFRQALDAIQRGERYVPEGFVEVSDPDEPQTHREDALARLTKLTNQQTRILQLICAGKLNKQIAFDLSIAEATVKAHVTAIMRKLGVQSRTQAVLIAQQASFSKLLPQETC